MSYEGYEMYMCPEGHQWSHDVYSHPSSKDNVCPWCQKTPVWACAVDQTNGDEEEPELEVAHPAPICECCGQATGPVRYVVPGPEV